MIKLSDLMLLSVCIAGGVSLLFKVNKAMIDYIYYVYSKQKLQTTEFSFRAEENQIELLWF